MHGDNRPAEDHRRRPYPHGVEEGWRWYRGQDVFSDDDQSDVSDPDIFLRSAEYDCVLAHIYLSAEKVGAHVCYYQLFVFISLLTKAFGESRKFHTVDSLRTVIRSQPPSDFYINPSNARHSGYECQVIPHCHNNTQRHSPRHGRMSSSRYLPKE